MLARIRGTSSVQRRGHSSGIGHWPKKPIGRGLPVRQIWVLLIAVLSRSQNLAVSDLPELLLVNKLLLRTKYFRTLFLIFGSKTMYRNTMYSPEILGRRIVGAHLRTPYGLFGA